MNQVRAKLSAHTGLLLVDGSNVRATVGGRYSQRELLDVFDAWAVSAGFGGRMLTVWDHGPRPAAFALPHSVAVFTGNTSVQNADDVLVKSIAYLFSGHGAASQEELIVVTSDNALGGRCTSQLHASKRGATGTASPRQLHVVPSIFFAWLFELDLKGRWQSAEELAARYAVPHSLRGQRTRDRKAQVAVAAAIGTKNQTHHSARIHKVQTCPYNCTPTVKFRRHALVCPM